MWREETDKLFVCIFLLGNDMIKERLMGHKSHIFYLNLENIALWADTDYTVVRILKDCIIFSNY